MTTQGDEHRLQMAALRRCNYRVGCALVLPLGISYREREAMLAERGVDVHHTTLSRRVQRYAPEIEKRLR